MAKKINHSKIKKMKKPLKRPQMKKRRWGLATRLEHPRIKEKKK